MTSGRFPLISPGSCSRPRQGQAKSLSLTSSFLGLPRTPRATVTCRGQDRRRGSLGLEQDLACGVAGTLPGSRAACAGGPGWRPCLYFLQPLQSLLGHCPSSDAVPPRTLALLGRWPREEPGRLLCFQLLGPRGTKPHGRACARRRPEADK